MADPTPTAADIEAANRALVPPIEEAGVGIATRIARALATARRDADAAGYARGVEEGRRVARAEWYSLRRDGPHAFQIGRAEGLREAASVPARLAEAYRDRHGGGGTYGLAMADCANAIRALTPPPTPEPTRSSSALPEQREWVAPDGLPDGFRLEASAMCGGKGPDHCRKGSSCRKHNGCVYRGGS